MTATEESLEFPLNTTLREDWVKPVVEFPSAQRLISVNSRSLTFGVWSRKSVASAKESSLTYVSVSYWLVVCHAGVNWKGETLTVNHSFSFFPIVPHATALPCPVFVVLSTFVVLHWPRFRIIRKNKWLGIHYWVYLSNNIKSRWSDLLTHWLMTHDSLTHKTYVLNFKRPWTWSLVYYTSQELSLSTNTVVLKQGKLQHTAVYVIKFRMT